MGITSREFHQIMAARAVAKLPARTEKFPVHLPVGSAPSTSSTFAVCSPAMGKPRMTQRDKWKKRPCVMRYRQWCDAIRAACPSPPPAPTTSTIKIVALYATRDKKLLGQMKRTKPDPDNIAKGILDALWEEDQAVGDLSISRRWSTIDMTVVEIHVIEGAP